MYRGGLSQNVYRFIVRLDPIYGVNGLPASSSNQLVQYEGNIDFKNTGGSSSFTTQRADVT